MEEEKIEKLSALAIAAAVMMIQLLQTFGILHLSLLDVGVSSSCGLRQRFLWPFIHAGLLHATLNVWCLLLVSFYYTVSFRSLALSYGVCVVIPPFVLGGATAVGLSGMLYFVFASLSFSVQRKLYWQAWMIISLIVGFFVPGFAAGVHLYCYAAGMAYALLTTPFRLRG